METGKYSPRHILRQLVVNTLHTDDGKSATVTGWIASGSTFIFQVLKEMGINVTKTHTLSRFRRFRGRIIYTIRDPRDIVVSTAKRHFIDTLQSRGIHSAIDEATDYFSKSLEKHISSFRHLENKNFLLIRYENYFNSDTRSLTRFLADQFNYHLSDDEIGLIADKFSIDKNIERSSKLKDFNYLDKETMLHGNHISNRGKIGVYKDYFNLENAEKLQQNLGHLLIEFGYESNRDWLAQFE